MTAAMPAIPWFQPLLLTVLLFGGLALRQWGRGRAPMIGMVLLWTGVAIATAWLGWSLSEALSLIQSA